LIAIAHLAKGDFVLIPAASSSVGIAATEIVKAEGAFSIATTRTRNKIAELLSLGADHVIATEGEDMVARVKEITRGKGARVIFDPVVGPGGPRKKHGSEAGTSLGRRSAGKGACTEPPRCRPSKLRASVRPNPRTVLNYPRYTQHVCSASGADHRRLGLPVAAELGDVRRPGGRLGLGAP
jgi:threonine dehydrogenase-like Zn-dependent dehydrogenase